LALGCLTACSNNKDDNPAVLDSASATAPTSTSTTPAAKPTGTPEAQIRAAVDRYYRIAEEAARTGDTTSLEALSAPSCSCRTLVRFIKESWSKGRLVGAKFAVSAVTPHDVRPPTGAATVTWSTPQHRLVDADGRVLKTFKAGTVRDDVQFVRDGNRWVVLNVVELS
jgi:hypothetical protein